MTSIFPMFSPNTLHNPYLVSVTLAQKTPNFMFENPHTAQTLPILKAGNTPNLFVSDILGKEATMLDNRLCHVRTAAELDKEIRDILFLDKIQRGHEIAGTLHVHYSDESVRKATLIPALELYGVVINWHKELEIR